MAASGEEAARGCGGRVVGRRCVCVCARACVCVSSFQRELPDGFACFSLCMNGGVRQRERVRVVQRTFLFWLLRLALK